MGMSVNIALKGDSIMIAKLEALGESLIDTSLVLKVIGKELLEYYSGIAWESRGGEFGVPWASLAPSTQRSKSKNFRTYSNTPLMATGNMKKSFYSKVGKNTLTIGNTAPYFKYHQSSAPRAVIPRRPMIGINNTVKAVVAANFELDIKTKIGLL
jgi:phage gpG-like protein